VDEKELEEERRTTTILEFENANVINHPNAESGVGTNHRSLQTKFQSKHGGWSS
jgi:hypothetical protein